jgi:hypothetical protein
MLLTLLAEEMTKDKKPRSRRRLFNCRRKAATRSVAHKSPEEFRNATN